MFYFYWGIPMKKFILFFIVFFSIVSSVIVQQSAAQPPTPCYTSPCTEIWHDYTTTHNYAPFTVKYTIHWRNCGGQIECVLDIISMTNANFFASGSNYETDFNGAKAMTEHMALNVLIGQLIAAGIPIPECNPGPGLPFVKFYTARCGVWVKCSFPLSNTPETCDNCWVGPHPSRYVIGGTSYVDVYKWQPCGTICCQKNYNICVGLDPLWGGMNYIITNVTRGPAPGAMCSGAGTCQDWKTGANIPCNDGCQGDGD